jgi:transcriptional regulator with PAS, ATPase and Fis domain
MLLDLIMEEVPSTRVSALLVNEKNQIVFDESRRIALSDNEDIDREAIKRALEEKHLLIVENFDGNSSFGASQKKPKGILCLPLVIDNKPAGIIYLERKFGLVPFSRANLEFLMAVSKPIKLILKSRQEFQDIGQKGTEVSNSLLAGQSRAFRRILTLIDRVKDSDAPVFIWGESGTGKELVARSIHQTGVRRKGKFVAVNCGAIPEQLLKSELFGYVKGAFTGAVRDKPGLIEEADGGTFFLDEVGDLSLYLQAKLLRLLEEKDIRRIGENRSRPVNVRFVSATNKNIEEEIKRGQFREDLYYRLKIIAIEFPPLRERKEDLFFLLNHFLEKYSTQMGRERPYLSPRALESLMSYSWPGNVRELQNEIRRCLILAGEDDIITEEHLSPRISPQPESAKVSPYNFLEARAEFEKRFLNQALARWNYNRGKTAEEIGLSRQGLFKLIKKRGIDIPNKKEIKLLE